MRLLGLVLALGAIVWVMMQVAGGGDTVVPEGHQAALEKAEGLEESLQQTVNEKMRDLEPE